jgi:hypothetical protein
MSKKPQPGESFIYRGIMENRAGQLVTIAHGTGVHGLAACTFPDGAVIGCNPNNLEQLEQLAEAA